MLNTGPELVRVEANQPHIARVDHALHEAVLIRRGTGEGGAERRAVVVIADHQGDGPGQGGQQALEPGIFRAPAVMGEVPHQDQPIRVGMHAHCMGQPLCQPRAGVETYDGLTLQGQVQVCHDKDLGHRVPLVFPCPQSLACRGVAKRGKSRPGDPKTQKKGGRLSPSVPMF